MCVSVNPYRTINIYGPDVVNQYKGELEIRAVSPSSSTRHATVCRRVRPAGLQGSPGVTRDHLTANCGADPAAATCARFCPRRAVFAASRAAGQEDAVGGVEECRHVIGWAVLSGAWVASLTGLDPTSLAGASSHPSSESYT